MDLRDGALVEARRLGGPRACDLSLATTGPGKAQFANPYYRFEGVFAQGVRRQGRLTLGDGSFYEGQFDAAGEITGSGYRRWASGASCVAERTGRRGQCPPPLRSTRPTPPPAADTRGSFCSASATAWYA